MSWLRMSPAAFAQQQQVAQQVVEHLQVELQLLALAAADGLGDRNPGAERRGAGSGFEQRQHGGAALVVSLQIERHGQARTAAGQHHAALRLVQAAREDERAHFLAARRREMERHGARADGGQQIVGVFRRS